MLDTMNEVNSKWLKAKIANNRGLQAQLAREIGLSPDKVSKIVSGTRGISARESELIRAFFNEEDKDVLPRVAELLRQLPEAVQAGLVPQLKGLVEAQRENEESE